MLSYGPHQGSPCWVNPGMLNRLRTVVRLLKFQKLAEDVQTGNTDAAPEGVAALCELRPNSAPDLVLRGEIRLSIARLAPQPKTIAKR